MEQTSAQWNGTKRKVRAGFLPHLGGQDCALLAACSLLVIKSFQNVDTRAMGLE